MLRYQDAGHKRLEGSCHPVLEELVRTCSLTGLASIDLPATLTALIDRVTMGKYCFDDESNKQMPAFFSDLQDFIILLVDTFPGIVADDNQDYIPRMLGSIYMESCQVEESPYCLRLLRTLADLGFSMEQARSGTLFYDLISLMDGVVMSGTHPDQEMQEMYFDLLDKLLPSDTKLVVSSSVSLMEMMKHPGTLTREHSIDYARLVVGTCQRLWDLGMPVSDMDPDGQTTHLQFLLRRLGKMGMYESWRSISHVILVVAARANMLREAVSFDYSILPYVNTVLKWREFPNNSYRVQSQRIRNYTAVLSYVLRQFSVEQRNNIACLKKILLMSPEFEFHCKASLTNFHQSIVELLTEPTSLKSNCCRIIRQHLLRVTPTGRVDTDVDKLDTTVQSNNPVESRTDTENRSAQTSDNICIHKSSPPLLISLHGSISAKLESVGLLSDMPLTHVACRLPVPRALIPDITGSHDLEGAIWDVWKEALSTD